MSYDTDRMGLVFIRHHLGWGLNHGALAWIPYWARKAIVVSWNAVACATIGHYTFGPYPAEGILKTCTACSRVWP